jgi:hypothetical protein
MLVILVHLAMLLQGTLDLMGGSDRLVSGLPRIAVGQDCVRLRCCGMAMSMRLSSSSSYNKNTEVLEAMITRYEV